MDYGTGIFFLLIVALVLGWTIESGVTEWLGLHSSSRRIRALQFSQVDLMDGPEFETYVARLLEHQGFRVELTPGSGDLGVGLVAKANGKQVAVQCKRSNESIGRRTVSDPVAAFPYYKCSKAWVVTNSWFTEKARMLSQSNNCTLVDREKLSNWILDFQGKEAQWMQPESQPVTVFQPRPTQPKRRGPAITILLLIEEAGIRGRPFVRKKSRRVSLRAPPIELGCTQ